MSSDWNRRDFLQLARVGGAVPKKAPLPWNPDSPDRGLGWRQIAIDRTGAKIGSVALR